MPSSVYISFDSTTILVGEAVRLECWGVGGNTVNKGTPIGKTGKTTGNVYVWWFTSYLHSLFLANYV